MVVLFFTLKQSKIKCSCIVADMVTNIVIRCFIHFQFDFSQVETTMPVVENPGDPDNFEKVSATS